MYVLGGLLASTLIVLCTAVGWAKLTKTIPRIFLSYHHSNYQQILDLAATLRQVRLKPSFVEFSNKPEHDMLLDDIHDRLGLSDFVICFPGPDPSFVESEIFHAIGIEKPIFIVLPKHHCGSPNTAQKSYPALIQEKLESENYNSLIAFITYLYGNWWSTTKLLCDVRDYNQAQISIGLRPLVPVLMLLGIAVLFGELIITVAQFVAVLLTSGWGVALFEMLEDYLVMILLAGIPSLFLCFAVLALLGGIWARWRARWIVRRKLTRGTYSLDSLKQLLGDSPFLTAFWPEAPQAHHEIASNLPAPRPPEFQITAK
jgi:hypothetical protein